MPDGPFITEVKQLMPALETAPANNLEACERVSAFLKNESDARTEAIRHLDEAMAAELIARNGGKSLWQHETDVLFETLRTPFQPAGMSDERWAELQEWKPVVTHLLSDVLSQKEAARGFSPFQKNGREQGQVITLLKFIQPDAFRNLVRNEMMWKDPGAGEGHGEYTHRIQWFLIMQALEEPKGGWTGFYSWIGTIRQPPGDEKSNPFLSLGLWDALVDRATDYPPDHPFLTTDKDFRSPERLLAFLLSDDNRNNQLLAAFLTGRRAKRQSPAGKYPNKLQAAGIFESGEILAKKVFGLSLAELPERYARELSRGLSTKSPLPDILYPQKVEADADSQGENHFMYELRKMLKQDVV